MVRISDSELEVMKVIWEKKETTSVEIIEALKDFNWNFNTTRTLIKRLLVKGAIEIVKKEGKTYTYRSAIDENEYKNFVTKALLKKLYNDSLVEFALDYCKNGEVSKREVKQVIREICEMIED